MRGYFDYVSITREEPNARLDIDDIAQMILKICIQNYQSFPVIFEKVRERQQPDLEDVRGIE